jgi:hypothetical protein
MNSSHIKQKAIAGTVKGAWRSACVALTLALAGLTLCAHAASTKTIVLDSIAAPSTSAAAAATNDAMAVSVLVESVDGTLTPRSTQMLFHTGDRFRVKVIASRAGKLSFYNTNPLGVTGRDPVWTGAVQPGQETISPRLRLDGASGEDQLHIVLEPAEPPQGVWVWLGQFLGNKSASKDIHLDVENSPQTSYVLNPSGQGLITTVHIVHTH